MRHSSRNAKERQQIERYLSQKGSGDAEVEEVIATSFGGPSGATMTLSLGGSRAITQVDGGGQLFWPGTAVQRQSSRTRSVIATTGVAPRHLQPTQAASLLLYDPYLVRTR